MNLKLCAAAVLALVLAACSEKSPSAKIETRWGADTLSVSVSGQAYIFVGSSSEAREDWIRPLSGDTLIINRMGMNDPDYGGGIPCAVVWTGKECVALGSLSPVPLDIAIPIERKGDTVRIWIDPLQAEMPEEFIYHGSGDCFAALRAYSEALAERGVIPASTESAALEPQWCAWGYGRTCTKQELLGTLPKVKEFGIPWVTLDDGFQVCEGDWSLNPEFYPGGDAEMRAMVDSIHAAGFKASIWWAPLAADPGCKFLLEHPDTPQLDADGKPYVISYWDSWYLSPTHPAVLEETRRLVHVFMEDWGFDGFKLDGQHLNCVNPDYAPGHHPDDPWYDARHLPEFFRLIYEEARSINPNAVVQLCPCGDVFSVYNLPYVNQTVSSDPTSSYQVRTKAYILKALAPGTAYYGDHVELTTGGRDFASQLAVGAVPGTKFTWPSFNKKTGSRSLLTPDKENLWSKAFEICESEKLPEATLLGGLYDLGFDKPETYVLSRENVLYYSLFAEEFDGEFTFRGLGKGNYSVVDLWTGELLGNVSAKAPTVHLIFKGYKQLKLEKI